MLGAPALHLSDIVIGLAVLAVLYRRVRQTIALQPLVRFRLRSRSAVFTGLSLVLLWADAAHPSAVTLDLAAIAGGAGLAAVAMRGTIIRRQASGLAYRPHPWIGSALTGLFIWRLAVRLYTAIRAGGDHLDSALLPQLHLQAYAQHRWTGALFLLLAAYAVVHAWLILRAASRLGASDAPGVMEAAAGRR